MRRPGPGGGSGRSGAARAAALALALAACDPAPGEVLPPAGPPDALAGLGGKREAWLGADAEARLAFARGDFAAAAEACERKVALFPRPAAGDGALPDLLLMDLFNLGCARSLAGRTAAALDALDLAFADGGGPVGVDHLRDDPDLDAVRGEARYAALVERLSWNEDVEVLPPSAGGPGPHPLAVVLLPGGPRNRLEATGPVVAARRLGFAVAVPRPPYLAGPGRHEWTTRLERGGRAARKAAFAVEAAARALAVDRVRLVLVAPGAEGRVGWEVVLREPTAFTAAVLGGPVPDASEVLDRGRPAARLIVAGSVPASFPLPASAAADFGQALREALR